MLRRHFQTLIWQYDRALTSIVALLPVSLQPYSSKLGKVTLPSIWAATLIIICLFVAANGYQKIAILGAIIIASIPVGSLIKLLVRRPRPKTIYAQNMKIKSYSFPSSHTYAATVAGGYLALLSFAVLPSPFNLVVGGALTLLIITIGVSRIHVGAHYPTDVTAGWLLGATVLFIVTRINF